MPDTTNAATPLDLVNNGTVLCSVAGKRYRLRRPMVGEFKMLRESLQATNDEIATDAEDRRLDGLDVDADTTTIGDEFNDLRERAQDGDVQARERLPDATERLKQSRQAGRDMIRAMQRKHESIRFVWIREVFVVLSMDGPLPGAPDEEGGEPDDDELEPWLADALLPSELVRHWQTRPLGRGGK